MSILNEQHVSATQTMDRVRWSAIIAGTFASLVSLAFLATLGAAIGMSAFDRGQDDIRHFAMAGGIYGIFSTIVAFAVGGWVAGRNSITYGRDNGLLNGMLVAAVTIPVILFLAGSAAAAMSPNQTYQGRSVNTPDASSIDSANMTVRSDNVEQMQRDGRRAAWSTLIGMVLALGVAGMTGHIAAKRDERATHDLPSIPNSGRMVPAQT